MGHGLKLVAAVLLAGGLLVSCGGSDEATDDEISAGQSTGSGDEGGGGDASDVADQLSQAVESATEVVAITEDNDPNDLIGRPTGYVSAAVIYDEGAECDELGSDCGATVEVWRSAEEAQDRSDYIQGILEASPILGTEYNYLDGAVLLRVSGELKPSVASEYEAAFSG